MLQTPFYVCEGRRCAQTSLKSVLEYKGISKSINELDKLVGADNENPIPLLLVVNALDYLNQNFIYPVKPEFENLSSEELEKLLVDSYPLSLHSRINMNQVKKSFNSIRNHKKYDVFFKRPSLDELKKFIDTGKIPLCLVNSDKYLGRNDRKRGHYLIINDIGKKFVYINDSGPKTASENRRILREEFQECWNLGMIDWDVLIVE